MALSRAAQQCFTMVASGRSYTPTQVPQGVPNTTTYFQDMVRDVLDRMIEKIFSVWVEYVIVWR